MKTLVRLVVVGTENLRVAGEVLSHYIYSCNGGSKRNPRTESFLSRSLGTFPLGHSDVCN